MEKLLIVLVCVVFVACTPQENGAPYTGRLKIDAGTEYAALDSPSRIGGACDGWNAVEIRRPGMAGTGMVDIICWKRQGDSIAITDRTGSHHPSGSASLWVD